MGSSPTPNKTPKSRLNIRPRHNSYMFMSCTPWIVIIYTYTALCGSTTAVQGIYALVVVFVSLFDSNILTFSLIFFISSYALCVNMRRGVVSYGVVVLLYLWWVRLAPVCAQVVLVCESAQVKLLKKSN